MNSVTEKRIRTAGTLGVASGVWAGTIGIYCRLIGGIVLGLLLLWLVLVVWLKDFGATVNNNNTINQGNVYCEVHCCEASNITQIILVHSEREKLVESLKTEMKSISSEKFQNAKITEKNLAKNAFKNLIVTPYKWGKTVTLHFGSLVIPDICGTQFASLTQYSKDATPTVSENNYEMFTSGEGVIGFPGCVEEFCQASPLLYRVYVHRFGNLVWTEVRWDASRYCQSLENLKHLKDALGVAYKDSVSGKTSPVSLTIFSGMF
jgi:hypothetical protein